MSEWVIVAVVGVILLFSAKKLPDMARGLGQSMRIFKSETRGLREDDERARGTDPAVGGSAPGRPAGSGTTDAPAASETPSSGGSAAS